MQTKTYNVYTYTELSKEAQKKARQNWINDNDLPFLSEHLNEICGELLTKNKIRSTGYKVLYSLSYCIGDGAMFEMYGNWKHNKKIYSIKVKQSGRYYHFNSKDIDITDEKGDHVDEKICNNFNDIYVKIAKEIEKEGYKYIENENSIENIANTSEANEYMFTIDGNIDANK